MEKSISKINVKLSFEGAEAFDTVVRLLDEAESKISELRSVLATTLKVEATEKEVEKEAEAVPKLTREKVIELAKNYLEAAKKPDGYYGVAVWTTTVEFIVNKEKQTVVALLRGYQTGHVLARGRAKTMEGDVYNEHIGKAIALAKALKVDVPKCFIEAPQPEQVEVGDIVRMRTGSIYKLTSRYEAVDRFKKGRGFKLNNTAVWAGENQMTLIDDTKYEVTGEL